MDEDCISDIITVATISTTDLVPMYTPHSQVVLNTHMTTEIIPNPFFSPLSTFSVRVATSSKAVVYDTIVSVVLIIDQREGETWTD